MFLTRFALQNVIMLDKDVIIELLNFPLSLYLISYFSLKVLEETTISIYSSVGDFCIFFSISFLIQIKLFFIMLQSLSFHSLQCYNYYYYIRLSAIPIKLLIITNSMPFIN